jgi:hypothetical protein
MVTNMSVLARCGVMQYCSNKRSLILPMYDVGPVLVLTRHIVVRATTASSVVATNFFFFFLLLLLVQLIESVPRESAVNSDVLPSNIRSNVHTKEGYDRANFFNEPNAFHRCSVENAFQVLRFSQDLFTNSPE